MLYSVYFSPTGGTKKVMDCLQSVWDFCEEIDLSDPSLNFSQFHFGSDDLCLIGVPSFEGRVPPLALQRISAMKADDTPCVLVTVFGNRDFNDTLLELEDTVLAIGFKPFAAISAVAHHSILTQYAVGRPDADDQAELKDFAAKIKDKAKNPVAPVAVPGNRPYIVIHVPSAQPLFNADSCIQCGQCAEKCPAQAISHEDYSIDTARCIHCMRCVSLCPTKARFLDVDHLQKLSTLIAKRFEGRKPNRIYL